MLWEASRSISACFDYVFLEQVLSVILISKELLYFFILISEVLSINNAEIISYLFFVWGLSRGVK